jgi:hypothetical protein
MPTDPDYVYADTPHERTVEKEGTKYGCWNSMRKIGYWVPVRNDDPESVDPMEWQCVIDRSSKDCKYDFRSTDSKCEGCLK